VLICESAALYEAGLTIEEFSITSKLVIVLHEVGEVDF
jgi:hypothetical protein